MKKRIIAMLMIAAVMISFVPFAAHASSNGDTMTSIIKYIKKGNVSKIRKLNKKLPKFAEEKCVINMSSAMRAAYKKEVQKWENNYEDGGYNNGYTFFDYYLTDINNDEMAELIIFNYPSWSTASADAYQYNDGSVNYIGSVGGADGYSAYPGHNGIIVEHSNQGWTAFYLVTIQDGKTHSEYLNSLGFDSGEEYINLRNTLKSHSKYKDGRYFPNYDVLDGKTEASPKTSITSISGNKKSITVKWKQKSKIKGYQIQYGLKSSFKGAKTVTVKTASSSSNIVSGLKPKTKYYVRVRTFRTESGKKYYSSWSSKKSVKTK